MPGETFLALGSLKSHEAMEAETITYHTVNEVRDAQASGLVFAFLSHQWLGWSAPDPANKHYESMCCAIRAVAQVPRRHSLTWVREASTAGHSSGRRSTAWMHE